MTAYISSKSRQLDEVLHSFLHEDMDVWPHAPPPVQLRDTCLQLIFSLVRALLLASYPHKLSLCGSTSCCI